MNRERGSASVWVVSASALLLLVGAIVTIRTAAVVVRHRADGAADLAALAAAGRIGVGGDPCVAAARIATANGTSLQTCRVALDPGGRSGTVVVRVRTATDLPVVGTQRVSASARAGRLAAGTS